MSTAIRRRRILLAISVLVLAVVPWLLAPGSTAIAQVVTTSTTEPTTTTTTLAPTTTTTRRPTTTRPPVTTTTTSTTTTTTTTLPPTTTTTVPPTTTTRAPQPTTTSIALTTTTAFIPPSPQEPPEAGSDTFAGLPGWSLPIVGAGAMLAAILLATGVIRFATDGIPAIGRGFGSLAYKTSSAWTRLTTRRPAGPAQYGVVKPTAGARIGGFFLALLTPFRRIGSLFGRRDSSARRLRIHRRNTVGGLWDRIVLKSRMARARLSRTRSSVDGQKRYWWLRFRRYIPWLR